MKPLGTPLGKGLILCVVHLLLVTSLGAKLLYDRATRPRVWVRAAPYDPDLPIRGRYVSLQLEVHTPDLTPPEKESRDWWRHQPVVLSVENDQLVARRDSSASEYDYYAPSGNSVRFREGTGAVLDQPVLYFIPEHIPDPSRREAGEELWVEVTVPKKGPPRPIRLGVKKDGIITPLDLD